MPLPADGAPPRAALPPRRRAAGRPRPGRQPRAREGDRALRPRPRRRRSPSYAVPTIVGELKRHLRDTRWSAYVPQRMRERVLEVDRATESPAARARPLADRRRRSPHETRHRGGRGGGGAPRRPPPTRPSRSTRRRAARRQTTPGPRCSTRSAPRRSATTWSSTRVTIEPALRALPARQRVILRLRFDEDMTQAEIAARLGMSQMHVSRLLRQALGRLREVARVRHGQEPPPSLPSAPDHGGMTAPPARLLG